MPNLIKQIPETMRKQRIPEEIIAKLKIPESNRSEDVMVLIEQMDKLMTKKQCLSVMQEQGCCTTGKPAAAHRTFGQENKDKTLAEKVSLLNEADMIHKAPCRLNPDGTLSVFGVKMIRKRGIVPADLPKNSLTALRCRSHFAVAAAVIFGVTTRSRSALICSLLK